jgi:hypothetical protein
MKHVIVVFGLYTEWLEFTDCLIQKKKVVSFRPGSYSVITTDSIMYHPMPADNYTKIMGFSKHTTSVIRIGTWYRNITEDAEKYLALFRGDE